MFEYLPFIKFHTWLYIRTHLECVQLKFKNMLINNEIMFLFGG